MQGNTSVRLIEVSNIKMHVYLVSQVVRIMGEWHVRLLARVTFISQNPRIQSWEREIWKVRSSSPLPLPDQQLPSLDGIPIGTGNSHFQRLQILLLDISDFLGWDQ